MKKKQKMSAEKGEKFYGKEIRGLPGDFVGGDQECTGFCVQADSSCAAGIYGQIPAGVQRERLLSAGGEQGLDDRLLDG